jgi:hypothetical protein
MASLNKVNVESVGPKLMPGSTGGEYFPFARKGNVLLGTRLQAIAPGGRFGLNGTTYFCARVRSAPVGNLFAEEDAKKKVVKLQANPPNLWDAWPNVVWEKRNDSRASTSIGVFIPGALKGGDEAGLKELLANIGEGKLAAKMAHYLFELAGPENAICRESELKAWLDEEFKPVMEGIVASLAKQQELQTEMKATIGNFGMQAALLKKVYGETKKDEHEPSDEPANEEADPDNEPGETD